MAVVTMTALVIGVVMRVIVMIVPAVVMTMAVMSMVTMSVVWRVRLVTVRRIDHAKSITPARRAVKRSSPYRLRMPPIARPAYPR